MKPAANLSLLWPELPFLERFNAAAAAGFKAVEVLFPYDVPVPEIQAVLRANGLQMILLNAPPQTDTGRARGFAATPNGEAQFEQDICHAFRYAQALGVSFIHVMTGDNAGPACLPTLIRNLTWAARAAPKGITLTLEPLCEATMPGYFMNDYVLAAEVLAAVDAPNCGLQYDSFHAQMIHGDAVATYEKYRSLVRHVQLGDAPDRGAPATGTVNFRELFHMMRSSGYDGWVSGEYHPGGPTEDTLGWMKLA